MEALGIDLVSLLWQIVAFVALIWLLNRMLFRPIRKTLDERAERIRQSTEDAEQVKQQLLRADEEYQSRIDEAKRQAQEIIGQAREDAREEREQIIAQAEEEAQQRRLDAQSQIDMERRDLVRESRQQVASLAVLAAGRIIGETLDPEKHQRLAETHIAALNEPLVELNRALVGIPRENIGAVQVRSAAVLTEQVQNDIRARVAGALGDEVEVVFSTEPGLLGGFVVQAGDQVVDLSVLRKLNDLFRELAA